MKSWLSQVMTSLAKKFARLARKLDPKNRTIESLYRDQLRHESMLEALRNLYLMRQNGTIRPVDEGGRPVGPVKELYGVHATPSDDLPERGQRIRVQEVQVFYLAQTDQPGKFSMRYEDVRLDCLESGMNVVEHRPEFQCWMPSRDQQVKAFLESYCFGE